LSRHAVVVRRFRVTIPRLSTLLDTYAARNILFVAVLVVLATIAIVVPLLERIVG